MTWFVVLAGLLVALGVAAAATGLGGSPAPVERLPGQVLPERELGAQDLRHARFETVSRGYDPEQVEALLDRVAAEWEARERGAVAAPEDAGVDPRV